MKTLALTILAALTITCAARAEIVRAEAMSFPAADLHHLRARLDVGQLEIVGGAGDSVRAVMTVRCRRFFGGCARRAEQLDLVPELRAGTLRLHVDGYPKFGSHGLKVKVRVEVPAGMDMDVKMGVGQLDVRDVRGGVNVSLGVGTADVRVSPDVVGSVHLNVGVGDVFLQRDHERRHGVGFIGHTLSWSEGAGSARVALDVGVGEAAVALR